MVNGARCAPYDCSVVSACNLLFRFLYRYAGIVVWFVFAAGWVTSIGQKMSLFAWFFQHYAVFISSTQHYSLKLIAKQLSQLFNGIHVAEKYLAGF